MEGVFNLNAAVIVELLKNIIIAILQKTGALDELDGLGIDFQDYVSRLISKPETDDSTI